MRASSVILFLGTQTFMAVWAIDNGPWWVDLIAIVTWAFAILVTWTADRMMASYEESLRKRETWRNQ